MDDPGGQGQQLDGIAAVAGADGEQPITRPHHVRMQQQPKLVEQIVGLDGPLGHGYARWT
jgi:hypothetical protein